jgi:uncharacterized circularly permuted ATP-grasp superfamily protein
MLIGPKATKEEHAKFREPWSKTIRQTILLSPLYPLSTVPTLTESGLEGRHVDLRPYILYGQEIEVIPECFDPGGIEKRIIGCQ